MSTGRTFNGQNAAFIALVVLVSVAFFWLLWPFYSAVLWATVLALLFQPLQRRLVRSFDGRRNLAAATTLLACFCIVLIPASLLLAALTQDVNNFYQRVSDRDFDPSESFERARAALPEPAVRLLGTLDIVSFESLRERVMSVLSEGSRAIATRLVSVGQGTARFLIGLGVMLYLLFFLIRDGAQIAVSIRKASPLSDQRTASLMEKSAQVVKATVKGNFIIALIQGSIGGIAFWALGVSGALLWGAAMVMLSLLPAIGALIIWGPVAAYLLISGEYVRGSILLAVGIVISLVDNFLRPLLVGKDIRLPDYLVLVSTVGGLALFGMNGFVIGPLIAALFVAVWAMRREEQQRG